MAGDEVDHNELAALARAATPGPWFVERGRGYPEVCVGNEVLAKLGFDAQLTGTRAETPLSPLSGAESNAAYIAAASPDVVLGLLEECEKLKGGGVSSVVGRAFHEGAMRTVEAERDAARTEAESEALNRIGAENERDEARALLREVLGVAGVRVAAVSLARRIEKHLGES